MFDYKPWQRLTPWLLKAECLLCERPVDQNRFHQLCRRCAGQLQQCQRQTEQQRTANLLIWGYYQDSLRRLLHQLKYQNQPAIAKILGQLLAQTWQQHRLPKCVVVPIPLHPSKRAQRGYNQAELIARSFCQFTGLPCHPQILQRTKATDAQHGLSRTQRHTNLQSAFSTVDQQHRSLPILLVDDIYTTGATIQAATSCLTRSGASVWGSLVVAR